MLSTFGVVVHYRNAPVPRARWWPGAPPLSRLLRESRKQPCDAYYGCIFPDTARFLANQGNFFQYGKQVPTPAAMRREGRDASRLGAPQYTPFAALSAYLEACYTSGVKADLTVFSAGGGSSLAWTRRSRMGLSDPTDPDDSINGVFWGDIESAAPAWQNGFLAQSEDGWDSWYWDPAVVLPATATEVVTAEQEAYQSVVLNLYPTATAYTSRGTPGTRSAYDAECARRKCLGVAAYADLLGEFLAWLDGVWQDAGMAGIGSVVEYIELSNELDGHWVKSGEENWQGDVPDEADVNAGEMEAGRFLALLAGPIHQHLPDMKFRFELPSWSRGELTTAADDPLGVKLQWLQDMIGLGFNDEVRRWRTIQAESVSTSPTDEDAIGWLALLEDDEVTGAADGDSWAWPPLDAEVGETADLLHEVGIHWYHGEDGVGTVEEQLWRYDDEVQLIADLQRLRTTIDQLDDPFPDPLTLSMGEIGFAAVDPNDYGGVASLEAVYRGTNESLQAAMLVRLLAAARAGGASHASWFTYIVGATEYNPKSGFANWAYTFGTSVRNDIYDSSTTTYEQAEDCWPRASWFAYRRLSWLLAQAAEGGLSVVTATAGFVLLRIEFKTPVEFGPDGEVFQTAWPRAYLTWLDQHCEDAGAHLDGSYRTGDTANIRGSWDASAASGASLSATTRPRGFGAFANYDLLSTVPLVSPDSSAAATDANGYSLGRGIEWEWTGWDAALKSRSAATSRIRGEPVDFEIWKASPADRPAPICVFTDQILSGA